MSDQIKELAIDKIAPHPDNPRLFLRDDVIEGIAAQLSEKGGFDPAHALLVRPLNGGYQIVRGHHRAKAAERAGLEIVPCWVREMSDDEAYLQLALGNVQGELSPLEIGIHALGIEFDKRGNGANGGGLKEYARQTQYDASNITKYRNAATVLSFINGHMTINEIGILDRARHLAEIHKTPQPVWSLLVGWMLDNDKSVNQTAEMVKTVNKFVIPDEWQTVFLALPDVVASYLGKGKPDPEQVTGLVNAAANLEKLIESHAQTLGPDLFPYTTAAFHEWLKAGIGLQSWDLAELAKYRQAVIEAAQEAVKPPEPDPQPGEWWQLGDHLLYCGDTSQPEFYEQLPAAAFAFADPPYNAGVDDWDFDFRWGHDWLMDRASIVAVTPGIESIQEFLCTTQMSYVWSMAAWIKNGMTRGKIGFGNWVYISLFSAEQSIYKNAQDVIQVTVKTGETDETDHKGRKPSELLEKLITLWSDPGELVIDPFLGSGTTLFECDRSGRKCIGGEIRPKYCKDIIKRWQDTTGQTASKR